MIYLNGTPLQVTKFPDQTSQVWNLDERLLDQTNWFHVTWKFESEAEFMHLAQLKTLLDEYGHRVALTITYLPYARQDKPVSNTTTFALTTFAHLLNSLRFESVIIADPHSQAALDKIKYSVGSYPIAAIDKTLLKTNSTVICFPDSGANTKYTRVLSPNLNPRLEYVHGLKHRDQMTGQITGLRLTPCNLTGKNVLIVDDICDGGMTFVLLAKELYKEGANEVNLFVSHGLFTKGLKPLIDANIKRIFTPTGEFFDYKTHVTFMED